MPRWVPAAPTPAESCGGRVSVTTTTGSAHRDSVSVVQGRGEAPRLGAAIKRSPARRRAPGPEPRAAWAPTLLSVTAGRASHKCEEVPTLLAGLESPGSLSWVLGETPLIPSTGNYSLEVENEPRDSARGYEPFGFKLAAAGARLRPDTCWDRAKSSPKPLLSFRGVTLGRGK